MLFIGHLLSCSLSNSVQGKYTTDYKSYELGNALKNFYNRRQESQKAIAELDRALELDPNYILAYVIRGNMYYDPSENQLAIAYFDRALELNPRTEIIIMIRGMLYELAGFPEKAIIDYDSILLRDTELAHALSSTIHNNRGLLLSRLGRYEEALESYERGLKEEPGNYVYLYNIAVLMVRLKRLSNAQTQVDTAHTALLAVEDADEQCLKLYGLGGLAAVADNSDEAMNYLEQAALLDKPFVVLCARKDIAWLDLHANPRFQAIISETINIGKHFIDF